MRWPWQSAKPVSYEELWARHPQPITASELPLAAPGVVGGQWSPMAFYLPGHPRYDEVKRAYGALIRELDAIPAGGHTAELSYDEFSASLPKAQR